jgi:transcriptional regulator with XRE-family HTH domain
VHFGQCLRGILARKNFTQQQAADLLEMRQPSFAYYLTKATPPRSDMVQFMAAKLGVSEAELLGESTAVSADGKQRVVVRESAAAYSAPVDPWPAWGRRLKSAFKRDPARVELAVRAAWPREADQILEWLRGGEGPSKQKGSRAP